MPQVIIGVAETATDTEVLASAVVLRTSQQEPVFAYTDIHRRRFRRKLLSARTLVPGYLQDAVIQHLHTIALACVTVRRGVGCGTEARNTAIRRALERAYYTTADLWNLCQDGVILDAATRVDARKLTAAIGANQVQPAARRTWAFAAARFVVRRAQEQLEHERLPTRPRRYVRALSQQIRSRRSRPSGEHCRADRQASR